MGLASINIRFAVDLASLSTQMQTAGRVMDKVASDFNKAAAKFNQAGQTLTTYVTLPIVGVGVAALKSFGDLEALQKGLISVMGSSTAASAEFEKLKEVAKLPGLGLEEAVRGSVNLQAAGFSADAARESLLAFGNALATVGKGKAELDRVILALTQLNNKSTGFGQDLRQLTEQLPQLRGALTAAFGTSDSEAIAKTGVTGRQVVEMLTKEFAKLPKVTGGFNNALENATDAAKIAMAQLGESINKAFDVEGKINRVADAVAGAVDTFKSWSPEAQKLALNIAAVAAAIGPVLLGIAGFAKIFAVAATGISVGLTGIGNALIFLGRAVAFLQANAIAVTAVLGLAYIAYKFLSTETVKLTAFQQEQNRVAGLGNRVNQDALKLIIDKKARLAQLLAVARDETQLENERRAAIAEINKISPEYLGNLTLETINTDAARGAIEKYNVALLKAARARAAQGLLEEFYKKQLEAQAATLKTDIALEKARDDRAKLSGDTRIKVEGQIQDNIKGTTGVRAKANKAIQDLSKKEERFLLSIINGNKEYLSLLNDVTTAEAAGGIPDGVKAGTIKYYKDRITALQKIHDEESNSEEENAKIRERIGEIQKKIDGLEGKRIKVETIYEIAQKNGFDIQAPQAPLSQGTIEAYDAQISKLREMQSTVATTSQFYYDLETAIAGLELEKEIKFDFPFDQVNNFSDTYQNFGQKFKETSEQIQEKAKEMQEVAQSVAGAFANAFENMSGRFLDSLSLANDGLQGFFKGLASTIIKLISAYLAQSLASSIAGATAAGAATGPASIFTTPAFIAEAIGGVLAAFAAIPKFETGGLIGGSSFSGDKNLIRVNSGERIINAEHQRWLERVAGGSALNGQMSVNVGGVFEVDGYKLRLVLDRTEKISKRNS